MKETKTGLIPVGTAISAFELDLGLSDRDFAQALDRSPRTIRRWRANLEI